MAEFDLDTEDVTIKEATTERYAVGENGYPDLDKLKLTAEDHQELVDGFLSDKFGSEYIARKLEVAHKRNTEEGE